MLCLFGLSLTFAALVPSSQSVDANTADVAEKISPEGDKSDDQNSDLETAEFKHFGKKHFGFGVPVGVPVAVPVQPVYVQPVHIQPVYQPVQYQHVQYQHVHTPDCGCNGGYNSGQNYGYNYNYHYNY